MEYSLHQLTHGNVLLFLGIVLAGFVLLRILKRYLPLVARKERIRRAITILLPIVETLFWIWVFYEAIPSLSSRHPLLGILVFTIALAVIIWFAWYQLRDYIAGIIFHSSVNLSEGDYVEINNTTGKVNKLKNRYMELTTSQGEVVLLPYASITDKKLIKKQITKQTRSYHFTLLVKGSEPSHAQTKAITHFIQCQPWSSLRTNPQVQFLHRENDGNLYEITLFTPSNSQGEKIKAELEKKFGQL
ncbi:MAG: hypothetical protein CSA95_08100 [Bacteroidetes bacterium]|nr:MAG: hypothetical protein CSA95_08100 [Bacteroidota bacterium]